MAWPGLEGMDLAKEVTCRQTYAWEETPWRWGEGHGRLAEARHVCSVLKAAVGGPEGQCTVWCLPAAAREEVRQWMKRRGASLEDRADVDYELSYLENMSSVGEAALPDVARKVRKVAQLSAFDRPLLEARTVERSTRTRPSSGFGTLADARGSSSTPKGGIAPS